jgi:hypothetical protein
MSTTCQRIANGKGINGQVTINYNSKPFFGAPTVYKKGSDPAVLSFQDTNSKMALRQSCTPRLKRSSGLPCTVHTREQKHLSLWQSR